MSLTVRAELQRGDPARIGRYSVRARLGSGGMGVVYLAEGREGLAAIKVIRPEYADDPEFRRRFRREVESAQRVGGRYTARVLDADVDAARPWVATEYVAGPNLSDLVALGPLSESNLAALALGLAEALSAVHAAGVIHRDIKPTNIIAAEDGPRLIDFGIATASDATSLTRTGMAMVSVGWSAPETLRGDERAGAPADVFGWALVLLFAASGTQPYGEGSADALVYRIVHGDPLPQVLTAVPEPLRPMISAALNKDPAGRPTARELQLGLLKLLTGSESADTGEATHRAVGRTWQAPSSATFNPTTARERRRRNLVGVGLAILTVATLVVGALILYPAHSSDRSNRSLPSGPTPATPVPTSSLVSNPMQPPSGSGSGAGPTVTTAPASEQGLAPGYYAAVSSADGVAGGPLATFLSDHDHQIVQLDTTFPSSAFVDATPSGQKSISYSSSAGAGGVQLQLPAHFDLIVHGQYRITGNFRVLATGMFQGVQTFSLEPA